MDSPGFYVRLDALLEAGGDYALAMEQWHRPPEEWERFRPVAVREQPSRGLDQLVIQTLTGPVTVVPHAFVPLGTIVVLQDGNRQSHSQPFRGVGLGTITEALDSRLRAGARNLRVCLAPADFADLLARSDELRRYDATPRARLNLVQFLADRAFVSPADAAELLGADKGFTAEVTVEPLEL